MWTQKNCRKSCKLCDGKKKANKGKHVFLNFGNEAVAIDFVFPIQFKDQTKVFKNLCLVIKKTVTIVRT